MAGGLLQLFFLLGWRSLLAVALICVVGSRSALRRKKVPLPPGPRGLPFVGNISDMPTSNHWLKFAELGTIWGDISSLTVLGQTMIIVNSVEIAEAVLDTRGANFSDRPVIPFGGELVGFNNVMALSQYGDRVRKERKIFHKFFGTQTSVQKLFPLLSSEVHKALRNIALNPRNVLEEIPRMTSAITLKIAYGYQLQDGPGTDPYQEMFATAGDNFVHSTTPAAFLVDTLPALRYWPEWLPGGGFHTTAKLWSKQLHTTVDSGLEYVKRQMAAGTAKVSVTSVLLEEDDHDDYLIKWAAASVEVGGSDTTAAQIEAFFLAMILYPEVQANAQAELDKVIGNDRLPELSDRSQLPYVDALCKETLRWHVAAPINIPHRAREDFVYHKDETSAPMLIPKNSLVITNIWKMTHDPERYKNPMTFNPSRFIAMDEKEAEQDPARICFGHGRRICPGKLLGDATLFMACSAILAVFNISKIRKNGVFVEPKLGQTSTTVSHPLPFECLVEPRNHRALALIQGV
ncbi:cytochrome P450 [Mycena alexandri]|uniref:Cytochrome P450 n=1 Tax=Mycena alexandri TaxID=1745969 RepID=A0AAD6S8J1_9AGAR|nr:cytochrome P450 [Mycena alexandri]